MSNFGYIQIICYISPGSAYSLITFEYRTQIFLRIVVTEIPAGYVFAAIRVEVTVPAAADLESDIVTLSQLRSEFFRSVCIRRDFGDGLSEELLLGLKTCEFLIRSHILVVSLIMYPIIFSLTLPILPLAYLIRCRRKQIYLMEMLTFAHIHQCLLHMSQQFICEMVFETGAAVAWALCEIGWGDVKLADAIQNNVYMDVSAFIVAVRMSADESLMSGKILSGKFKSELLGLLACQPRFRDIFRIKADDVMMGFDLPVTVVLAECHVDLIALS